MSCKNYIPRDIPPCSIERPKHEDAIKAASNMVGLDLTKPIDLSLAQVRNVGTEPYYDMYSIIEKEFQIKRHTTLHAIVRNEFGESEELTITFELISKRMPKIE